MSFYNYKQIKELNLMVSECGKSVIYILNNKEYSIRVNNQGYCQVNIPYKPKPKNLSVHRLVAMGFIENPLNLRDVNHIDGCKTNNNASNLEWLSNADNIRHGHKIGLFDNAILARTKTTRNLLIMRLFENGYTRKRLSKIFKLNKTTVTRIISRYKTKECLEELLKL
jgi:hypothetical protein